MCSKKNSKKCFVIRSIDQIFCRISKRRLLLVAEDRACDNRSTTSELWEPGQNRTETEYCMPSCFSIKTLLIEPIVI